MYIFGPGHCSYARKFEKCRMDCRDWLPLDTLQPTDFHRVVFPKRNFFFFYYSQIINDEIFVIRIKFILNFLLSIVSQNLYLYLLFFTQFSIQRIISRLMNIFERTSRIIIVARIKVLPCHSYRSENQQRREESCCIP